MRSVALLAGGLVLGGCAIPTPRAAPFVAPRLAASDSVETDGKPRALLAPSAPATFRDSRSLECPDKFYGCFGDDVELPEAPPKPGSSPGTKAPGAGQI